MKYAILMTDGAGAWERLTPAEQADVFRKHGEFRAALEREGKYVWSGRLDGAASARTVRRDAAGRSRVCDGPFAETKEILGGIYVIEAGSLAEALEWAERGRFIAGSNEVRPFLE
ncbi:MAG TPA: YciI family protein [Myxococcota bacterium]|nr:YciI family protein [Myxococcota bacterium]